MPSESHSSPESPTRDTTPRTLTALAQSTTPMSTRGLRNRGVREVRVLSESKLVQLVERLLRQRIDECSGIGSVGDASAADPDMLIATPTRTASPVPAGKPSSSRGDEAAARRIQLIRAMFDKRAKRPAL